MLQNRIADRHLSIDLVDDSFVSKGLDLLSLGNYIFSIDLASFLCDARVFHDVQANNVMLVELLGPPLWDPVFDFIFNIFLIWTFSQRSCQ